MLVVPIIAKNSQEAGAKIRQALLYPIDAIELRLDFYEQINIAEIAPLKKDFNIPIIFTLRKESQGGFYKGDEVQRLQILEHLAALCPEYLDIEHDVTQEFVAKIHKNYPAIKLICSYHDFQKTVDDLNGLLQTMFREEFYLYKIAVQADSIFDTVHMLNFVYEKSKYLKICGISMGEFGIATRILSPVINNALNYVSLEENQHTAPGQIDLKTLFDIYGYRTLNCNTRIYALLGDPVDHSKSHIFHNQQFKKAQKNAVFIKMQVAAHELAEFLLSIKPLPFDGFCVTMPLKEKIIPCLDELSDEVQQIKAVNTVVVSKGRYVGYNTDGIGALDAIEKHTKVLAKKIIILGAGGAAKPIAYEAIKRGAKVIILNRHRERAESVAAQFGCEGYGMDAMAIIYKKGYDILINATSMGMKEQSRLLPLGEQHILPQSIILEMVTFPEETLLLKNARAKNCICVTGQEVFVRQGLVQQSIWR